MFIRNLSAALLFVICVVACHKKNNSPNRYLCHADLPYIDTITNELGTLLYDEHANAYIIRIVQNGTIDNVDLYILCDDYKGLPAVNSTVTFSGFVKPSTLQGEFWGTIYHELELTEIK